MKTTLNKQFWDRLLETSDFYEIKTADLSIVTPDSFKKLRNDLNFTQKRFADIIGVSNKTIEKWEQGSNPIKGAAKRLIYLFIKDKTLVNQIYSERFVSPNFSTSIIKIENEKYLYSFYSAKDEEKFKKENLSWSKTETFQHLTF